MNKTLLLATITGLVITAAILAPRYVENRLNRVSGPVLSPLNSSIAALHRSLFVADLHADTLLWDRNIAEQSRYGHIDLPRMRKAGVALQVFSMVSKTPHGLNLQSNGDDSDDITALALVQRWPIKTWFSLAERINYMSARLADLEKDQDNHFILVKNQSTLHRFLRIRETQADTIAGLLSIEGAHAFEGSLKQIDEFYAQGVRFVGLTHFFDNEIGGSAHGKAKQGLTDFGKQAITKMQSLGIVIDLAHSSSVLFEQVVHSSQYPLIVSHTGVKGTCDKSRNLSDRQLRQIAATGGLIGIGFWPTAVCGNDINAIVKSIAYAVKVAGINSVTLGSDFDGSVSTPFDVTGLPHLTAALLAHGFSEHQVSKIMGGNLLNFLKNNLPE